MKLIKHIPTDKPFIRCDYSVAEREHVHLYDNISLLGKSNLSKPLHLIHKKNRVTRKKFGLKKLNFDRIVNSCVRKSYKYIQKHKYHDEYELNKIIVGEEVYIIREYSDSGDLQYMIYDAKCIRKIDNYVEWVISESGYCHPDIFKNYYRLKKFETILKEEK